jgi:hypothetical protein
MYESSSPSQLLLLLLVLVILFPFSSSLQCASEFNGTADWMWTMREQLRNVALIDLTLPATHDSGTYNLSSVTSPALPSDMAQLINTIKQQLPQLDIHQIMIRWARTQRTSIFDQLCMGIRMLDIRVCYDSSTDLFRIHHFVMSNEDLVGQVLHSILTFTIQHPHELLVLSLSHFEGMNTTLHQRFIGQLQSLLGAIAIPCANCTAAANLSTSSSPLFETFGSLMSRNRRVLILYEDETLASQNAQLLWPASLLLSDWANVDAADALWTYATSSIQQNSALTDRFYYPQWVLTPTDDDILHSLYDTSLLQSVQAMSRNVNSHFFSFFTDSTARRWRVWALFADWFEEAPVVDLALRVARLGPACVNDRTVRCVDLLLQCPQANVSSRCVLACGTCFPVIGEVGDACTSDHNCTVSGSRCQNSVCISPYARSSGHSCGESFQCQSGVCDNWMCDGELSDSESNMQRVSWLLALSLFLLLMFL